MVQEVSLSPRRTDFDLREFSWGLQWTKQQGQVCLGLLLFFVVNIVPQMHRTSPKWRDLRDNLSRRKNNYLRKTQRKKHSLTDLVSFVQKSFFTFYCLVTKTLSSNLVLALNPSWTSAMKCHISVFYVYEKGFFEYVFCYSIQGI